MFKCWILPAVLATAVVVFVPTDCCLEVDGRSGQGESSEDTELHRGSIQPLLVGPRRLHQRSGTNPRPSNDPWGTGRGRGNQWVCHPPITMPSHSFNQSINRSIDRSIDRSVGRSVSQFVPTDQSIKQNLYSSLQDPCLFDIVHTNLVFYWTHQFAFHISSSI